VALNSAALYSAALYNAAEWLLDRNIACGRGENVAIRYLGVNVTYSDVLQSTWRAQNALTSLGIHPGERVVILANDGPDMVAWLLGCLRSGVIPIPVSTMLTGADVGMIASDSEAVALVASPDYEPLVPAVVSGNASMRHAVVLDVSAEHRANDFYDSNVGELSGKLNVWRWTSCNDYTEAKVASTGADTSAFWLYSSGTTGLPKGVMHRHASMEATFHTYARGVLHVEATDRFLSVAKLFFAYGMGNSLTFPFGAGATTILEPSRPVPATYCNLVRDEAPTLFFASPGFVAGVLDTDTPVASFASVRATVIAGETLPADLQRRFSERFAHPVLDGIGSTEALHIFLSNTLQDQRPGSTGVEISGYELRLLGDDGSEVTEPDAPGYLHVRGPSTATGYWNRAEATAAAFSEDGWVKRVMFTHVRRMVILRFWAVTTT
jgi:acyl-coenzyme A synthetase/AMP-(fatty) acid ligase